MRVISNTDDKPNNIANIDCGKKLDQRARKRMQHLFKVYLQQYFKEKLGKGVDYTNVLICDDIMVIRGEGFLTEPEKFIVQTPSGKEVVRAARNTCCPTACFR